jgi:hypothetical protein
VHLGVFHLRCYFAVVLLFGLVLATSSSIFIAAPILLNLGEKHLRAGRVANDAKRAVASSRPNRSPKAAERQA